MIVVKSSKEYLNIFGRSFVCKRQMPARLKSSAINVINSQKTRLMSVWAVQIYFGVDLKILQFHFQIRIRPCQSLFILQIVTNFTLLNASGHCGCASNVFFVLGTRGAVLHHSAETVLCFRIHVLFVCLFLFPSQSISNTLLM